MIEDISSVVIALIVTVAVAFLLRGWKDLFSEWLGKKKKDTPQTPQRKSDTLVKNNTRQNKSDDEDWIVVVYEPPQRKVISPPPRDSSLPVTTPDWIIHEDEFDYQTKEWRDLSKWYRNQKNWICEMCGLNLKHDKYFLDTHHTQGTKYNDPKYLKALCIGCHAEQREGQHQKLMFYDDLRYKERYQEFINTYGRQWQMRFINEVLRPPEE